MRKETRPESDQVPARRELVGFFDALWHVKAKSGIAMALGIVLIWLNESKRLGGHAVLGQMLEHLGLAFIVCAIAIFGYEWHSHQRQIEALARQLSDSIQKVAEMQKSLTQYNTDSFKEQLPKLFPNREDNALVGPITDLVTKAEKLSKAPRWTEKFVAQLLRSIVLKNADELGHLGQDTGDYRGAITVTEAKAVDQMLRAQMEELDAGDHYDVISDLKSWKEKQLEQFHEASIDAATNRSVLVRRIFNLVEEDLNNLATAEEAIKVLEEHLHDSSECDGKYQVRVLLKKDIEQPLLREQLGTEQWRKLHADHFGIFTSAKFDHESGMLRVEIRQNFRLYMATAEFYITEYRERFQAAWEAIPPLDRKWIEEEKKRISTSRLLASGEQTNESANISSAPEQIH